MSYSNTFGPHDFDFLVGSNKTKEKHGSASLNYNVDDDDNVEATAQFNCTPTGNNEVSNTITFGAGVNGVYTASDQTLSNKINIGGTKYDKLTVTFTPGASTMTGTLQETSTIEGEPVSWEADSGTGGGEEEKASAAAYGKS